MDATVPETRRLSQSNRMNLLSDSFQVPKKQKAQNEQPSTSSGKQEVAVEYRIAVEYGIAIIAGMTNSVETIVLENPECS